jgi:SAM-dependent methyltransferase
MTLSQTAAHVHVHGEQRGRCTARVVARTHFWWFSDQHVGSRPENFTSVATGIYLEGGMTTASTPFEITAEGYAQKLFDSALGAFEVLSAYAGDRLGWYRSLATDGPASSVELAARTSTQERYCREWLEMQASFGTLTVDTATTADERRFTLPPGPAEVLTDEHSLAYLGALPRLIAAVGPQLESLLGAYRNGGGVSWAALGADAREAQAALNRPWFESRLAPALNSCEGLRAVLSSPDIRIADVGCGGGWSTIALAQAYPHAQVVGVDVDSPAIDMARAAANEAGLADRVSFKVAEGESLSEDDQFDAVFAFECLHDMPRPVEVLSSIRRSVRSGGLVVIMDEAVAENFSAPADEVDQVMYGFSLFVCLPDGLSSTPSAGTGTVMRPQVLTDYATRAGFSRVEVLPIEDFSFFRFYQLHG